MNDNDRDKIIIENTKLVYYTYKKFFSKNNIDIKDDLIQEGMIGLIKATDAFKTEYKTRFTSFAINCIKNQMILYIKKISKHKDNISMNSEIYVDNRENTKKFDFEDAIISNVDIEDEIIAKETLERVDKFINKISNPKQRNAFKDVIKNRIETGATRLSEVANKNKISTTYVNIIQSEFTFLLKEELKKK